MVRVDADFAGDAQGLFGDAARVEVCVGEQGAGGGQGIGATGADGKSAIGLIRGDQVTCSGEDEGVAFIGDEQEGFEVAQGAISAPLFREFDGGAFEVAVELFEFSFEASEKGEGIGGGAGEAGQDTIVVEAADLTGAALHDGIAHGDLAIGGHDDAACAADEEHSSTMGSHLRKGITIESVQGASQAADLREGG